MLLKALILLVMISLGATLLMRRPQSRRTGWIVTGSLVALGLLVIQICARSTRCSAKLRYERTRRTEGDQVDGQDNRTL